MLTTLMSDHANIRKLMAVLYHKLELIKNGKRISYELLRDIIEYLRADIERYHHFQEEHIFDYCIERTPASDHEVLLKLKDQHKTLEQQNEQLQTMVDMILLDSIVPLDRLSDLLQQFIELQKSHMACEENEAMPLINKLLGPADWTKINQQLSLDMRDDPLFGNKVADNYRQLFNRIREVDIANDQGYKGCDDDNPLK